MNLRDKTCTVVGDGKDSVQVEPIYIYIYKEKLRGTSTEIYHTKHLLTGFIFEPIGQLKSFENCAVLDSDPSIRN